MTGEGARGTRRRGRLATFAFALVLGGGAVVAAVGPAGASPAGLDSGHGRGGRGGPAADLVSLHEVAVTATGGSHDDHRPVHLAAGLVSAGLLFFLSGSWTWLRRREPRRVVRSRPARACRAPPAFAAAPSS